MHDRTVTVFGGTGFLGRRIVRHLRKRGYSIRIASRHPDRGHRLFALDDPQLQSVAANIHDERACLDHVVVFGERHLRHLLRSYEHYYNQTRTHRSLNKDSPVTRSVETVGRILPLSILGGLHHQYVRI
jgi:uncharacterized protein YbjT (DUF2867 family)